MHPLLLLVLGGKDAAVVNLLTNEKVCTLLYCPLILTFSASECAVSITRDARYTVLVHVARHLGEGLPDCLCWLEVDMDTKLFQLPNQIEGLVRVRVLLVLAKTALGRPSPSHRTGHYRTFCLDYLADGTQSFY
jgi:hypothetical protein